MYSEKWKGIKFMLIIDDVMFDVIVLDIYNDVVVVVCCGVDVVVGQFLFVMCCMLVGYMVIEYCGLLGVWMCLFVGVICWVIGKFNMGC